FESNREASDRSRPRLSSIRKRPLVVEVYRGRSDFHRQIEPRQSPSKFRHQRSRLSQQGAHHGYFVSRTRLQKRERELKRSHPSNRYGPAAQFAGQISAGAPYPHPSWLPW